MVHDKRVEQYIHAVSVHMNCPSKIKKKLLSNIYNDIENAIENGIVTPDTIEKVFGAPKDTSELYLQNLDLAELKNEIRKRKRKIVLAASVICLVLLIGVYTFIFLMTNHKHGSEIVNGIIVTTSST